MIKNCIDCGKEGVVERRRCKDCAKKFNNQRLKKYYNKETKNRYGIGTCSICKEPMKLNHKDQLAHISCRKKCVDSYNKLPRSSKGNMVARQIVKDMGIEIPSGWVVHHIDENPENNSILNLLICSRAAHSTLHRILQTQWSLFLKENSSNSVNCWNSIRDQITTTWFEKTGVNVIKISDICQSAAKPLILKEYEEGSET